MSDEHDEEDRITPTSESQWQREALRLQALAKERGRENRALKEQLAAITSERDEFAEAIDELREERDTLKAGADELQGKLRGHSYKAKFAELAKAAGVDPDFADDLFELAKLDTSADEPDAKAIGSRLEELKQAKPRYFLKAEAEEEGGKQGEQQPAAKDGLRLGNLPEGTSTGGRQAPPGNRGSALVVKRSQLSDPNWAIQNSAAVQAAYLAGDLTVN